MNEHEFQCDLLPRLRLLVAAAKMKLAGAELSELVLVTLEQSISARELNLTRQGYNRALGALECQKLFCLQGKKPQLHPETCAKFGISKIESHAEGVDLLRMLAEGSLAKRSERVNLYLCNADGVPASVDESKVLFENLKDAAVHIASWLGKINQMDVLKRWIYPEGASRELLMRGMASIVQGYFDGRLGKAWPGGLGEAMTRAINSVRPEYPRVLNPHAVLDRFRAYLRQIQDKKAANPVASNQIKANQSKQAIAVPKTGHDAATNRPPTA